MNSLPKCLLHGLDTVECCYYLSLGQGGAFRFDELHAAKEAVARSKKREPVVIKLGRFEFLLQGSGTSSGYPLLFKNRDYTISCGEFNSPSFYVKFSSHALWHKGVQALHEGFLQWAVEMGFVVEKSETLSRVDFAFDFSLPEPDFDEDNVVSLSAKDGTHRKDRKTQTINYGTGDVVLRVYNKVDEINEKSKKTWFFDLWGGQSEGVWRVEWQARKEVLKRFGIRSFAQLHQSKGDLLRYLSHEHDTLRVPNGDSNNSRWALHPLWVALQSEIARYDCTGMYRQVDEQAALDEQLRRLAISVYGYLKKASAIQQLLTDGKAHSPDAAMDGLRPHFKDIHDPMTWRVDVRKRVDGLRLGER